MHWTGTEECPVPKAESHCHGSRYALRWKIKFCQLVRDFGLRGYEAKRVL